MVFVMIKFIGFLYVLDVVFWLLFFMFLVGVILLMIVWFKIWDENFVWMEFLLINKLLELVFLGMVKWLVFNCLGFFGFLLLIKFLICLRVVFWFIIFLKLFFLLEKFCVRCGLGNLFLFLLIRLDWSLYVCKCFLSFWILNICL